MTVTSDTVPRSDYHMHCDNDVSMDSGLVSSDTVPRAHNLDSGPASSDTVPRATNKDFYCGATLKDSYRRAQSQPVNGTGHLNLKSRNLMRKKYHHIKSHKIC